MDSDRARRLVVRLAVRQRDGRAVRRIRLRLRAGGPASVVLQTLLRRVLAERRRGGSVTIDRAPDELADLLTACGLDPGTLAVSR